MCASVALVLIYLRSVRFLGSRSVQSKWWDERVLPLCGRQSVQCMCAISCIHLRPVAESWLIPCADKSCGCNFPSTRPGGMNYIHSSFCSHFKFYAATYCCLNVLQCTRLFFYTNYIWSARAIVFFLPFQMIICDCAIVTCNPWTARECAGLWTCT